VASRDRDIRFSATSGAQAARHSSAVGGFDQSPGKFRVFEKAFRSRFVRVSTLSAGHFIRTSAP